MQQVQSQQRVIEDASESESEMHGDEEQEVSEIVDQKEQISETSESMINTTNVRNLVQQRANFKNNAPPVGYSVKDFFTKNKKPAQKGQAANEKLMQARNAAFSNNWTRTRSSRGQRPELAQKFAKQ